jgi:DNA polymerase III subunit delta
MILFLYGADTYRSRVNLHEQVERFKQLRDPQGYNVVMLDALEEKHGSKIWSEMLSSPFLAEKRMVVVENVLASKHDDLIEQITERVSAGGFPESNIIVFWEGEDEPKAKAKKELFALLKAEKYATEFALLDDRKREVWIQDEVKKHTMTISRDAVNYLSVNTGGDLWLTHNVIEQVCAYVSAREITKTDVMLFVDPTADDNIFALVDAVVSKQFARAQKLISDQYKVGKEPQYILAMLIRQYRILIQLADLFAHQDGVSSDMAAKKLGIHPFVAKKTLPLVKRVSLAELQAIHTELFEIDKKTKYGANAAVLLDVFVLQN